ncbi:MAG TPA: cupin domain-containing protein [Longimicrobiaceae bacterium]|nr:cupin domain-containing protein [Longimicrobiaceae bacterium]
MPSINRPLAGEILSFHLADEAAQVERTGLAERQGRSARTLVKNGPMRVTLITVAAGETIPEHRAPGPVTVMPISGQVTFHMDGSDAPLEVGDLLALGPGVVHTVSSESGGAFVLTVVNPEGTPSRTGG